MISGKVINNIRLIPLSKGLATIVDAEDYDKVVAMGVWTLHSNGYAYRFDRSVKPNKAIFLHRLINNTPVDMHTDHVNRIRLDNRKENLRSVTQKENNANNPENRMKTIYVDLPIRVTFDKSRNKYVGKTPGRKGKSKRFNTLEEATAYANL